MRLTDAEPVSVYWAPPIEPKSGVERLINNRVARSSEEVRELDGRGPLVNNKEANRAGGGGGGGSGEPSMAATKHGERRGG